MGQWVKVCPAVEAPDPGKLGEYNAQGVALCVANIDGKLTALDNLCPHRGGPLSEGWIEGNAVVCPWHAWAFDAGTGDCAEEHSRVPVYPLKREGGDVLVSID